MNDKELLELAKKAEGNNYLWGENAFGSGYVILLGGGYSRYWNPLKDDGDALRLAMILGLVVSPHGGSISSWIGDIDCEEFVEDDLMSATRRAIVRAAAEVGKGMLTQDEFIQMFPDKFYDSVLKALND